MTTTALPAPGPRPAERTVAEQWASYSQLVTHRVCPQRWQYGAVQRLERADSEDVQVEREFGSWWQAWRAADSLDRGRKLGTLKALPADLQTGAPGVLIDVHKATAAYVLLHAEEWWRHQHAEVKDAWVERLGDSLPARLVDLDMRWQERWGDEVAREQPLAVELKWRRVLPTTKDPVTGVTLDPNTALIGYVDEVYYDTARGIVVARDNKSHKSLSTQTAADDMMDSQLQLYAWAASPLVASWGRGAIKATAYDRVRSVKPKAPVLTQAGSLSKSVTDYDVMTYSLWAEPGVAYPGRKKDGSDAGTYTLDEAVVTRLSSPAARSVWFQRALSPLNPNLIRAHLRAAIDSALDMRTTRTRAEATREAARNLGPSCKWCDFASLCRAQMVGGPSGTYDLDEHRLRVKS